MRADFVSRRPMTPVTMQAHSCEWVSPLGPVKNGRPFRILLVERGLISLWRHDGCFPGHSAAFALLMISSAILVDGTLPSSMARPQVISTTFRKP